MSWQAYIDQMVGAKVRMAGIYGKSNCGVWGCTPNFQPSPDEIKVILDVITSNNQAIFTTGLRLCGQRWTVIRMEGDTLVLKGKDDVNQKQNMIVAVSNTALILGANVEENVSAGTVRVSVEGIRDYLKSMQY